MNMGGIGFLFVSFLAKTNNNPTKFVVFRCPTTNDWYFRSALSSDFDIIHNMNIFRTEKQCICN